MQRSAVVAAVVLATLGHARLARRGERQPIYEGAVDSDANLARSVDSSAPQKPPGYRNAWDDCGGIGASATERTRALAAKIKGWAKPLPFVRHAAQDCGNVDPSGTVPGPGERVVYPGPETLEKLRAGLKTAEDTLEAYPSTDAQ
eukprot:TRINITY_DN421_c0_g1_i4.p1 TRINITY_DN421_c0_g1~~TRINITY_DN421_c0_g1_i4.p1  ORF type:complete len:145 (+),score=25.25 TRINITY_DN421_c0_g1_i4:80-514(+)